MTAEIIDGKACAADIEVGLKQRITALAASGRSPHLAVVIVGEDPASRVYVGAKQRACERLAIESTRIDMASTASFDEVVSTVRRLNADDSIDGILVQSPLPAGMDEVAITDLISPAKDVDGFHAANLGRLVQGDTSGLLPCTPAGVMRLLDWSGVEVSGARAVIVGRSRIVGMPLSLLLAQKGVDATVTIAHSRSRELAALCRQADILVAAVGSAGLVAADWVRPGAVVIDVGVNRVDDPGTTRGYRLVGDVEATAFEVASAMTPVPGGVGPMTIAMLMSNTVRTAEMRSAD